MFHVSLLRRYHPGGEEAVIPDPVVVGEHEELEVEAIVGHRRYRGQQQFRVWWKGYTIGEDTWKPEEHLKHANWLLEDYRTAHYL